MSALLAAFISVCNCAWPLHLQWETARGISSSSSVSTFLLIHSSSCSASKEQAWESCARLWVPLECLQGRLTGKRTLELLQYLLGVHITTQLIHATFSHVRLNPHSSVFHSYQESQPELLNSSFLAQP